MSTKRKIEVVDLVSDDEQENRPPDSEIELSDDLDDDETEERTKSNTSQLRFPVPSMLELMVLLTWICLTTCSYKNSLFGQIFLSAAVLSQFCASASLTFCPGLFEAIQAAKPPGVAFFMGLSADFKRIWAVYVLVLTKFGCIPLIYVGSATDAKKGAVTRMNQYDRLDWNAIPRYVAEAIRRGYKISHKGILVSAPIPSAANVPRFRLLFLAMEAAFSFVFWAMQSRKPDHTMRSCCPWSLSDFEYAGLCSHNALSEGVIATTFDLSPAQLEAIAADVKANSRLWEKRYRETAQFKQWYRDYHRKYISTEHGKEVRRKGQAKYRKERPGKKRANMKRSQLKIKTTQKYVCGLCAVACKGPWEVTRHNGSSRHLNKVAKQTAGRLIHRCTTCSFATETQQQFDKHLKSDFHRNSVTAVAGSST